MPATVQVARGAHGGIETAPPPSSTPRVQVAEGRMTGTAPPATASPRVQVATGRVFAFPPAAPAEYPLTRVRLKTGGVSRLVSLHYKAPGGRIIPPLPADLPEDVPPVALVVTVTNFTPVTPTTTGAVFTFQTDPGVSSTRIMEYRVAGAPTWTTFKTPVVRTPDAGGVVSHTAGYTGLTAGTAYQYRITLTAADGRASAVLTGTFTTATTVVSPPARPKLRISPPTLVDPLTITVPVTGGSYKGLNGRDVRWVLPAQVMTGQLSIFGGRHHHIIGGEVRMQQSGTAFDLEQWTGDMYVEGVVADPTGVGPHGEDEAWPAYVERPVVPPFFGDAFRPNSSAAGARFILQQAYIQVDGFAKYADGSNGPHGDAIQCYTGPSSLLVDTLSVDTYYQGGFILPKQQGTPPTSFGPYRATDVDVHRHASAGGAGAWTLGSGPTDVEYLRCHARRDPGSNTNLVSGLKAADWTVSLDAPSAGRNVPRASVGVGYVSPGYLT